MNRRNFLGFVGAVMAAPKKIIAQAAVPTSLDALKLTATDTGGFVGMAQAPSIPSAQQQLVQLLGKGTERKQEEMRNFYINGLDPDTAGLRSLSIGAKIRMTKRIQYEQSQKNQELTLRGIVNGIFG